MTTTDKPVQRVTTGVYSVLFAGGGKARPIVIRISRGDLLEFREQRRRQWFPLPAEAAFRAAIEREAARALAHSTPRIFAASTRRRRLAKAG